MEYHISTNNSIHLYEDLKHHGVITSRLGYNISVAVSSINVTQTQVSMEPEQITQALDQCPLLFNSKIFLLINCTFNTLHPPN